MCRATGRAEADRYAEKRKRYAAFNPRMAIRKIVPTGRLGGRRSAGLEKPAARRDDKRFDAEKLFDRPHRENDRRNL
jgi:hypothetical protein